MKYLWLLIFFVALNVNADERLKLPFWGASGEKYTTDTFGSVLGRNYPGTRPVLMLIATQSNNSSEFRRQTSEINAIDHDLESLQLLVATASSEDSNKSGYWLMPHAAAVLLNGKQFSVLFLKGDGTLCNKSTVVVSAASIRKLVGKCH